ncbi:hypothetical protein ACFP2T_37510 [Plantactinospora solaniradicis]|uniref:CD-NTase-associated protein 15 domain-containing protein n=1 Tax=Plantactinospora solaniradicis TaxID=1723736 RepID=A0ABW1KLL5_9ACTN
MVPKRNIYAAYFVTYALAAGVHYQLTHGFGTPFSGVRALTSASFSIGPAFLGVLSFDRYLWRFKPSRAVFGIEVPFISGRWIGYVRSTYTDHKVEHPVVLEIWQTLSSVDVWYYDENAVTHSLISGFVRPGNGGPVRLYSIYFNQPITTQYATLHAHNGVMDLVVDRSETRITGTYFNNPHQRKTYGEIRLTLQQRRHLGHFQDSTPGQKGKETASSG